MNMMLVSNKQNVIILGDRNDSPATWKERLVVRGSPKAIDPSARTSRFILTEEFRMKVIRY